MKATINFEDLPENAEVSGKAWSAGTPHWKEPDPPSVVFEFHRESVDSVRKRCDSRVVRLEISDLRLK